MPALAATAAVQGGVFSAAQAKACGYSSREIERLRACGAWVPLRRGIYAERSTGEPAQGDPRASHRLEVAAAVLALSRKDAVASHLSAAVLWGLDTLDEPDLSVVRLTCPAPGWSHSYPGLRILPAGLPAHHRTTLDGMAVTVVPRTVVDVAGDTSFRAGVVLADSALRCTDTTKADLHRVVDESRHLPGALAARRVVAFADGRPQSVAESLARVVFAEAGLPDPRPQAKLVDATGLIGYADYLFEEQRTVAEIDGRMKYVPSTSVDADWSTVAGRQELGEIIWREKRREDRIRELDLEVVRFCWADLQHPHRVRARALAAFTRAQRRAG